MQTEHPTAHADAEHPKERVYVKVAVILAIVTGIEIWLSYVELAGWILATALILLSLVKFTMVVGYFMHLKFDHPTLRKPFLAGLITALLVYTIVLVSLLYHSRGTPAS